MQDFVKITYPEYVILRDLLSELQENEAAEDRLTPKEAAVLSKIEQILSNMDRRRKEDLSAARGDWARRQAIVQGQEGQR